MSILTFDTSFTKKVEELGGATASVCYQCGTCTATCPLGVQVRKLLRDIQLGAKDDAVNDNNVWACATCKLCELRCPKGVSITDLLHSLRVLAFEARKAPAKLEQAIWAIYEEGNPYGGKKSERAKWAEGLNVKVAGNGKQASRYLVYAGCAASFDPRLQSIARSLVEVLQKAGAEVSILGENESCCGDLVYQIGEESFLEELVEKNIKAFNESGAETLITISPHCLNMFRSVYPHYGKMPNVLHYTEVLAQFVDRGDLKLGNKVNDRRDGERITTTYHDPCYLGRYYGIYEEPRKILESIPGIELTEMSDNKENALCCGGGGGQMWKENESTTRPSHERVSQAALTNSSVLATSCPYCVQNFEDAAKTKGLKLEVRDVSELLNWSMKPDGGLS
jgi:Fe-S oxidoreductase